MARVELRNRMPIMSPSLHDLTAFSAATQDDQKNR